MTNLATSAPATLENTVETKTVDKYANLFPSPVEMAKIRNEIRDGHNKIIEKSLDRMNKMLAAVIRLADTGYQLTLTKGELSYWDANRELKGIEELRKVRKALGKWEITGKSIKDSQEALLWVQIGWKEWPGITFRFEMKLPPNGPCKIVTETLPSSTCTYLACDATS